MWKHPTQCIEDGQATTEDGVRQRRSEDALIQSPATTLVHFLVTAETPSLLDLRTQLTTSPALACAVDGHKRALAKTTMS